MASQGSVIRIIATSYGKDFFKERDVFLREVIPELKIWCSRHNLHLQETVVLWGGTSGDGIEPLLEEISQCYFNNIMPFFINITSDRLGLVPTWDQASESLVREYQKRLHVSTSQMELLFAAYRRDNQNSAFIVRSDAFQEELSREEQKKYFVSADIMPKALRNIAQKLLTQYPEDRVLHYTYDSAGFDHCKGKLHIEVGTSFSNQCVEFVKQRLWQERVQVEPPGELPADSYRQQREAQGSFMCSRSHSLRGREDIIQKIEDYIVSGDQDVPLLLLGGAGSGKSSVMARVADRTVHKAAARLIPNGDPHGWHVIYHFVGAAPRSTELAFLLKRLCKELDIIHESAIPEDLNLLSQLCCNALINTNTRAVIIIIDAINQFDEDHAAVVMSWLPRKLAPQVRCVLSLIDDTPQHRTLMARESKPIELHMTPLDFNSRRQIVQETLGHLACPLTADQLNRLLAKQTSENPLWLSMACEELRLAAGNGLEPSTLDATLDGLPDGLLNLLEQVLSRFEQEEEGQLIVATLCLLEASSTGLLEDELLTMLGDQSTIEPPSPFDEKEEKESSEKQGCHSPRSRLSTDRWRRVFHILRPFLRPYGGSGEGRLDFYHRAMSKAVRRRLFKQCDDNSFDEEVHELRLFWHRRLADYFEHCDNMERKAEEYLYHLGKIGDVGRLVHSLTDWNMFDKLYNEEFSSLLLSYWRQVGGSAEMISEYSDLLARLEREHPNDEEQLAMRHQHVARIFLQAGKYGESLELTKVSLKLEEKDLGNRPERMVELYSLMSEIYDEKLKLNDFVSRSQIPDLQKTISYGRKSIAQRKQMEGDYHKLKLGLSLMKLAFSLESWEACGGDAQLSGPEALAEGNKHIDTALEIFKELKDDGHYAEALMTKGVLAKRGSMEQLKYYNEAMDICLQVYGEKSLLMSRLYINIGIVWEDNKNYVKAYEYFCKWCAVSEHVLGPTHPKTLRAKGVLKEPRYVLVANILGRQGEHWGQNNEPDEGSINREVGALDDIVEDPGALQEGILATWPDDAEEDLAALGPNGLAHLPPALRAALIDIYLSFGQSGDNAEVDGETGGEQVEVPATGLDGSGEQAPGDSNRDVDDSFDAESDDADNRNALSDNEDSVH